MADPGWHQAPDGGWWWWDGVEWSIGPVPPAPPPHLDPALAAQRNRALMAWVLGLLLGVIGALIAHLTNNDPPGSLGRESAREALNVSLVLLVVQIPVFVILMALMVGFVASIDPNDDQIAFGGFYLAMAAVSLLSLPLTIFSWFAHIKGMIAAGRGEAYRAPLPFRFLKGEALPAEA